MRLSQTVALGDGRDAVVRELRVRDVRALLEVLPAELLSEGVTLEQLRAWAPEALRWAGDALTLPGEMTVEDLSASEVLALADAWLALHQDFFARLGLTGVALRAAAPPPPEPSPTTP